MSTLKTRSLIGIPSVNPFLPDYLPRIGIPRDAPSLQYLWMKLQAFLVLIQQIFSSIVVQSKMVRNIPC